jgi:hypothetical protein
MAPKESSNHEREPKDLDPRPPRDIAGLARWFAEAVRAELEALEREGGTQTYELHSGKLIGSEGSNKAVYSFLLADGTRIPEESSGRLKAQGGEFSASIGAQEGNIIEVSVEGKQLPASIHFAQLIVDDTALLRKLAEVLEDCSTKGTAVSRLAVATFHPSLVSIGSKPLPSTPGLTCITGPTRDILEKACGSSVTYIWGPPGTGKTYAIAHLVTALIESGERVLVTSHTHTAVNQALYEAVKEEDSKRGPLADHQAVASGKVLRLGRTTSEKIPHWVRFDKILEDRGGELQEMILETETRMRPIAELVQRARNALSKWDRLAELESRLDEILTAIQRADREQIGAKKAIDLSRAAIHQHTKVLENARHAWFRRKTKIKRAEEALKGSHSDLQYAERILLSAAREKEKLLRMMSSLEEATQDQRVLCEELPERHAIERELLGKTSELKPLEESLAALQQQLSQLGQTIIREAQAVFCTLTKNYNGKELDGEEFDAVIVDEISIAIPPLIFLAAGRAKLRVILVGDFLQLPPIVRSDTETTKRVLRKDVFHLAGIVTDGKLSDSYGILATLTTQRRMLPAIADAARHLVYRKAGCHLTDDTDFIRQEAQPTWLDFLPDNPLIIMDTADLHCWSGKQPGTLSRFNTYSAVLAVDIAAMAAKRIQRPVDGEPQPVAIITPYAAQRRLLSKLIADMELSQWVAAGTVHSFQGNEAKLVIFDCVLDEPYYTARLCNPKITKEVLRDLNVAVTRAKRKFVLVGSSEWLNKHARPTSGLGQLWGFLKGPAVLLSALDFIATEFPQRVMSIADEAFTWEIPECEEGRTIQILDDESFFGRFAEDINSCDSSIFALAPFFGEYRWPRIQPLFNAALHRGVQVTIVTPPLAEAENKAYVEGVIKNLRSLGAVVAPSSGLHGKDVIIDERIVYAGSMNWSSHRGRREVIHRIESPKYAKQCLDFLQAEHIRHAVVNQDGTPRLSPCGHPLQVVNQRRQHFRWDFQAMKIGCADRKCEGYLRDIDERPPFVRVPVCQVDGRTKYRRVRRGRGEIWQCPKHPRKCPTEKVVPGDPG